jgi:hypothetical protein
MPETTGDVRHLEQVFGNMLLDTDRASSTLTSRHVQVGDSPSVRDKDTDSL